MIKIPSVEQIRQCDAAAIQQGYMSSWQLMEQAATTCVTHLEQLFPQHDISFQIWCGTGNNGGDGLVIARHLLQHGYAVQTVLLYYSNSLSADNAENLYLLQQMPGADIIEVRTAEQVPAVQAMVVVDAILGTGISRPVEHDIIKQAILCINNSSAYVFSVDVPSGMYADKPMDKGSIAVHADFTHSLAFPKLGYMFASNYPYVGEWCSYEIGLPTPCVQAIYARNYAITTQDVKNMLPPRHKFDHKYIYGHGLLVAGKKAMTGAAVMAAKAAMRAGIGLLTTHIPSSCLNIMQIAVNEAICSVDDNEDVFTGMPFSSLHYTAVAVGPGLGTHALTSQGLKRLIADYGGPMLFDADAINILAQNPTWLSFIPPHCIFTPHIKEFERMVGNSGNEYERMELQRQFSIKYKAIVVLKGAHTCISAPDGNCYFNLNGNPGMATAGSGDVLTGIILAMLCQHVPALHAAIAGVYMHAAAADYAVQHQSMASLTAGDIIENIKYV